MRRHLLKAILIAPFVVLPVWLAALGFELLSKNQVQYRYFEEALDPVIVTPTNLRWEPPDAPLNREITPADAERIGLALTEAWQALAAAQSAGNSDILRDRYTGIALDRAMTSVEDASEHGGRISVLSQSAKPLFYHMDGSLMQLELRLLTARYVIGEDGLPFHEMTWDTGVVTLKNQTSGWRIFSYERRDAEPAGQGRAPWEQRKLLGVNYYPIESPWRAFWESFDAELFAQDLDRIRNLGANSIRIFLGYQDFADPGTARQNLPKLAELLSIAEQNGIFVIPTLFDLKPSFSPGSWASDMIYLENVLSVLDKSTAVSFIDLKNEADLDFAAHNEGEIRAWLRTMIGAIREHSPNVSLSVGWSNADAAGNLTDILDVVSYHEFGPAGATSEGLLSSRKAAGGLPLVITEIGTSSYELALSFPGSQQGQAELLQERLAALDSADGVLVWTLYDFPHVDGSVIGASPLRKNLQAEYGLFKADGSEKPSARAVRQAFTSMKP